MDMKPAFPTVTQQGTHKPSQVNSPVQVPADELVAKGKELLRRYALADLQATLANFENSATPPDCSKRRERLADLLEQIRMTEGK